MTENTVNKEIFFSATASKLFECVWLFWGVGALRVKQANKLIIGGTGWPICNWHIIYLFFYKQSVHKQVPLGWQIANQLSGFNPLSLFHICLEATIKTTD